MEEVHLVGRQRAQDFLNDVQLVYLAFPRKERLSVAQLSHDAPYGPDVHRFAIGGADGRGKHPMRLFCYSVQSAAVMWKLRCFTAAAKTT